MNYRELLDGSETPEIITFTEDTGVTSKGAYFPDLNLILVNDKYTDIEHENIIIHELGHKKCKHDHNSISAPSVKIKQEAQADQFMIDTRAKEWLEEENNNESDTINIYDFLSYFHFSKKYYEMAEKSFKKLLQNGL
ncbi:MAG: hypothetical protein LBI13_07500 [Streptococcaceae bacterium]|jgi:hypothetical protein|nr:hypothetical protein [Streptococcaceae bacterium]